MGKPPWLVVIAGPNGAGKSTFAARFLPVLATNLPFINVDDLARTMVPGTPTPDVTAARAAVRQIEEFSARRQSFVIETTLSGREHLNRLCRLRNEGWKTMLIFLGIRSVQEALSRVAQRVHAGGHDVPEHVIRRRFNRSLDNLVEAAETVNVAIIMENSGNLPRLIAYGREGVLDFLELDCSPALASRLESLKRSVQND